MDKNKLLYFIKDRGYKVEDFLIKLDMSKGKFYRRCNNKSFSIQEIWEIAKLLNLTVEEINSIFFVDFVS